MLIFTKSVRPALPYFLSRFKEEIECQFVEILELMFLILKYFYFSWASSLILRVKEILNKPIFLSIGIQFVQIFDGLAIVGEPDHVTICITPMLSKEFIDLNPFCGEAAHTNFQVSRVNVMILFLKLVFELIKLRLQISILSGLDLQE